MKKILAMILMTAVLVCPVLASGEAAAAPAAAPAVAADTAQAPHYVLQVIEPATCTENGVSAYADESTGEVLFTFDTAATGHVPSADHATCEDPVVCLNCGEVLEPATGHSYSYQFDAVRNEDGSFADFGTWKCDKCGDVVAATEGNAVYYYGQEEPAPAPEASGEPAASAEPAASGEPAAEGSEEAGAAAPAPANPNYDPAGHNWASIEIILALVIVVVGAILMLSFGKKKNG
jgi:hypothetical protein